MRRLLDPASQRIIKILESLLATEDWTTFSSLSALVDASERTIAKDISFIKSTWGHLLNLEVSKKHGVRFINKITDGISLIFTDIYNNSLGLRWIKELFYFPNKNIEYFEKKLFVSRSTLIRLLPAINQYLLEQKMTVLCRDGVYQFLGEDEQQLRDFTASFFLKLYGPDLTKSDLGRDVGVEPDVIKNLLLSFLKPKVSPAQFEWTSKDQVILNYHILFYSISLVRERQGYTVTSAYPLEEEAGSDYITSLQGCFPSLLLNNLRTIYAYTLRNYNDWHSKEESELVTSEIVYYLERFFSDLNIPLTEEVRTTLSQIMIAGYFISKIRPFKSKNLYNRHYFFLLSVKVSNPFLFHVMKENLQLLSQAIHIDMTTRISMILYWTSLICPEITQLTQPVTALLIDGAGEIHADFLVKRLAGFSNGMMSNLKVVKAPYPSTFSNDAIQCYDILITNIPNLNVYHPKLILINDYPTINNWLQIYEACIEKASLV